MNSQVLCTQDASATDTRHDFVQLYTAYELQLRAYARKLVASSSDADDVLQEAALVMLQKFNRSLASASFVPWARRVILYKVLQHRRRQQRYHARFMNCEMAWLPDEKQQDTQQQVLWRDEHEDFAKIQRCLGRLTPSSRQIFCARFEAGQEVDEIAQRFGRSVQAIYRMLSRTREVIQICSGKAQTTVAR